MKKMLSGCLLAALTFLSATVGHADVVVPASTVVVKNDYAAKRAANRVAAFGAYIAQHTSLSGVDANTRGFGYGITMKHETPDDFFASFSAMYANPRVSQSGMKNRDRSWIGSLNLGYTWAACESSIFTAYLGAGYQNNQVNYRSLNFKVTSFGTSAAAGFHFNTILSENWDLGLWAEFDWIVSGRYKQGQTVTNNGSTVLTAGDYKMRNPWYIYADIPLTWHLSGYMNGWDLALHGIYEYGHMKLQGTQVTQNSNTWGGFLELGYNY